MRSNFQNRGVCTACAFGECSECAGECECPCPKSMSNLPQSVTDRYVSSLVSAGYNKEFKIDSITCLPFVAEEVHCGHYFRASIIPTAGGELITSAGPTLHQAVRAALAKAGVTFR